MNTQQPAELRVYRHVTEIDEREWNSIIEPGDLQMTHRFVRACQESGVEEARYWHLLFYRNGELEAIACLSTMNVSLDLLSTGLVRAAIRAVRQLLPGFLVVPVLFCGLPVSFGRSSIRFRPQAERQAIALSVARKMEEIACREGIRLLCFKEFFDEDARYLSGLGVAGYFRAPSIPFCRLAIRWGDFDAYLSSLRAGYRRHVRLTLRRAEREKLDLQLIGDFQELAPEIFRLYEQTMDRAEFQLERLNCRFFENLNRLLGSQCCALVARLDGSIASAAVLLREPETTTFLLAGIDYRLNRRADAYINLVIRILATAIRDGARRLDLGQTSYFLKRSLGAEVLPVHLYLRHRVGWCNRLLRRLSPLLFPDTLLPSMRVFRRSPGPPEG